MKRVKGVILSRQSTKKHLIDFSKLLLYQLNTLDKGFLFWSNQSMDVGKRLRQLREAKGLSQGDIERRSGLLRSYISRVEGGYTAPSLATLEKFSKALEVEPYQLLFQGEGKPSAPKVPEQASLGKPVKRLLKSFESMSSTNRKLLMTMAAKLAKH
jgi:transcriptional regulator with XRE-family HTH domain